MVWAKACLFIYRHFNDAVARIENRCVVTMSCWSVNSFDFALKKTALSLKRSCHFSRANSNELTDQQNMFYHIHVLSMSYIQMAQFVCVQHTLGWKPCLAHFAVVPGAILVSITDVSTSVVWRCERFPANLALCHLHLHLVVTRWFVQGTACRGRRLQNRSILAMDIRH